MRTQARDDIKRMRCVRARPPFDHALVGAPGQADPAKSTASMASARMQSTMAKAVVPATAVTIARLWSVMLSSSQDRLQNRAAKNVTELHHIITLVS